MEDLAFSESDIEMLRRFGVSEARLAPLLRAAGVNSPVDSTTAQAATYSPLTATEIQALKAGGARGLSFEDQTKLQHAAIRLLNMMASEYREILETALGLSSVARLLNCPETEVQRRVISAPPLLHAVHLKNGQLLFPQWQFTNSGEIPHLSSILALTGTSVSPLALSRFMRLPTCDLESQGGPLSPRDWLIDTGNPRPVLDLARFMTSD